MMIVANGTDGMHVAQVKQLVGEWLAAYRPGVTGLVGAHFVGSITTTPDDAAFAPYDDVDLHLIFEAGHPLLESHGPFPNVLETAYHGLILEGGYKPIDDYRSPEVVLANPEIAHNLTVDSLLYDPDGWLHRLQEPVRREYPRRQWVLSRVEHERRGIAWWQGLRPIAQSMDTSGLSEYRLLGYHLSFLACLLCDATLWPPTSRVQRLRDILAEFDRLDLYEEAIAVVGYRDIPVGQVERLLQEGAEAFDLATRVRRSPHPFQHKLNPHQRGHFVDKCRSYICAGKMDAAIGWLLTYYVATIDVILRDGPEDVKPLYADRRNQLLRMLSIETAQARAERFARMERLDQRAFGLADAIIAGNPALT